ncbi:dynamin family protein [Halocynthiibacter namhaensis]|uniref:dynamin family protein n=1 Tax=Halocynthiibacter namhaensis TaxID=1290553 RepID=UPI000579934D|nr:dynamin family protein [Halocynthiibacter namhaensis]
MTRNLHLLAIGNDGISGLTNAYTELSGQIDQLTAVADARTSSKLAGLKSKMEDFTANVTLVGQVKAGKSALTNILAGDPGLLPSDVNPWTSVVTTLNINTRAPAGTKSKFTFFDQEEWDNLMVGGGRLGELASRAGAEDEMEDIQHQIAMMKEKSEDRLGKHFDLILGQSHQYDYYDADLIERYVCLGDEDDPESVDAKVGRFADVTKSAELFLDLPEYPVSLKLCDTPGVNDTFMVREQITLRALRGSEVCIVVLAAHQALSTMDMALMRIIAQFENRQVILFVNRVDELEDPVAQIPEIRERVLETLKQSGVDPKTDVIFGSAKWAEAAMTGDTAQLSSDSRASLNKMHMATAVGSVSDPVNTIWELSGMPSLLKAMNERITDGSGARLLERTRRSARNLGKQIRATSVARQLSDTGSVERDFEGRSPVQVMDDLRADYEVKIAKITAGLREKLVQRMRNAEANFVKRATDSLIAHLEQYGEQGTWQYDPTGLRMLQKAAYFSFARNMRSQVGAIYGQATADLEGIYQGLLGNHLGEFSIESPAVPRVPPPLGIGRTIALDLQSTWWRRWWQKRKGYEAFAADYARLISSEASSISADIEENQVAAVLDNIRTGLGDFLQEHQETLLEIAKMGGEAPAKDSAIAAKLLSEQSKEALLGDILKGLGSEAA